MNEYFQDNCIRNANLAMVAPSREDDPFVEMTMATRATWHGQEEISATALKTFCGVCENANTRSAECEPLHVCWKRARFQVGSTTGVLRSRYAGAEMLAALLFIASELRHATRPHLAIESRPAGHRWRLPYPASWCGDHRSMTRAPRARSRPDRRHRSRHSFRREAHSTRSRRRSSRSRCAPRLRRWRRRSWYPWSSIQWYMRQKTDMPAGTGANIHSRPARS